MNAEKIKNKSVGISLEEYKCELELMKKQYGQEEELYPWIYMILREAGITKKYSVRSVAGARSAKDVNGRELFMGYAAFPDIAIVDKSFMSGEEYNYEVEIDKLLCCVEAKELSESLLNVKGDVCIKSLNVIYIKSSLGRPYYIYYKIIADTQVVDFFDRYSGKTFKIINNEHQTFVEEIIKEKEKALEQDMVFSIIKNDNGLQFIDANKKCMLSICNNEDEYVCEVSKGAKKLNDILNSNEFYISIQKDIPFVCINGQNSKLLKNNGKASAYGELIGELLWYGHIIYTNGDIWKYIKIRNYNDSVGKFRKDKYDICVKNNKKHQWCKEFSGKESFNVEVENLIEINDKTRDEDWAEFINKLSKISSKWME